MQSRVSFLCKPQEETFLGSFDNRDDKGMKEVSNEVCRGRAKTCSNKSRNGIVVGPVQRIWVQHGRFFKGVKAGTFFENAPNKVNQALQVRRLHAAKISEKTVPRPIVKDISTNLMQICSQLPYFKKSEGDPASVTISRIKLRKSNNTPTKNSCSMRTCIKKPAKHGKKISVKEALRCKEWVIKAKPEILKSFFLAVDKSNGILPEVPETFNFAYKYFVGPGNNSRLIEKCLSTRWWWTSVSESELDEANFVWTQWKSQDYIENLQSCQNFPEIESFSKLEIQTSVQLFKENEKPYNVDLNSLNYSKITKSRNFVKLKPTKMNSSELRIYNKLEYNFEISNKKNLFFNLKKYFEDKGKNLFDVVPVTFHVTGNNDSFSEFKKFFRENSDAGENLWIVKPGENSNRGNGIFICNNLEEIQAAVSINSSKRTYIIQKYIENPYLIKQRKFDIRCFALVTSINGIMQGYFYTEGYIRTSSKVFSLSRNSKFIHLTNDAVQKQSEEYGKFESNNKISFAEFEKYLAVNYPKTVNFSEIVNSIKAIVLDTIQATGPSLDPKKRMNCFEIFGYDFLLDDELKPWLLEVNTNPCLELASSHLTRIIPNMIENALRIAVDPLFLEPKSYLRHIKSSLDLVENKFELIFHSEKCSKSGKKSIISPVLLPNEEDYCEDESIYSESSEN